MHSKHFIIRLLHQTLILLAALSLTMCFVRKGVPGEGFEDDNTDSSEGGDDDRVAGDGDTDGVTGDGDGGTSGDGDGDGDSGGTAGDGDGDSGGTSGDGDGDGDGDSDSGGTSGDGDGDGDSGGTSGDGDGDSGGTSGDGDGDGDSGGSSSGGAAGGESSGGASTGGTGTGGMGTGGETPVNVCEDNGGCDELTTCTDVSGTAECGQCPVGYGGDGASGCTPALIALNPSVGALATTLNDVDTSYDLGIPIVAQTLALTPVTAAGVTVSIQGADVAAGATWTSSTLPLGETTLVIVVSEPGRTDAVYYLEVTRGQLEAYVKASNTDANDSFGKVVALSADGNTLAVGASGEDSAATALSGTEADNTASIAGAVYVFSRSGSTWVQQAYVKASNTAAGDSFGEALALSADGNTLAVGASGEDSSAVGVNGNEADNSASSAGAVYIFDRSSDSWEQFAYVKALNTGADDGFGSSVTLSANGNTLAVGAPYENGSSTGVNGSDNNSMNDAGATYVFTRSDSGWGQEAYIKAENTDGLELEDINFDYIATGVDIVTDGDRFGASVSLSADGNLLAIGAPDEDGDDVGLSGDQSNNDSFGSGAAYLFTRSSGNWSQQEYIKASNAGGDRESPETMYGNYVIRSGHHFGEKVTLSAIGSTLAVGMAQEDSSASGPRTVYIFTDSGENWTQEAYVNASTGGRDFFGHSVALSSDGSILAVGASGEDSAATNINGNQEDNTATSAGAVYVFTRNGENWTQEAYVKASNTDGGDYFGGSVALSGDGGTLAVGAYGEESAATGIDGNQADDTAASAGAVYVYY